MEQVREKQQGMLFICFHWNVPDINLFYNYIIFSELREEIHELRDTVLWVINNAFIKVCRHSINIQSL